MTDSDEVRRVSQVDIKGRMVDIHELTDAQMALMVREVRMLQREGTDANRKTDAIARMFEILESVAIKAEDREYMEDLVVKGELNLREMTSFVTVFFEGDGEAIKPKVRRGRAPAKR